MSSDTSSGTPTQVLLVYDGDLSNDVARQIETSKPASASAVTVTFQSAADRPTKWMDGWKNHASSVVCFILQTIENAAPTEDGGTTVRFFKRQSHPSDLLSFRYAVLGLGDSNLLLDRQSTAAKDCNQVAQYMDTRLTALGGSRLCDCGLADERTGLTEVEPWIQTFWQAILG